MTRVLAIGFTMPRAIAVADGSIFVADTEQGTVVRVQDGVRSTVAEIDSNKAGGSSARQRTVERIPVEVREEYLSSSGRRPTVPSW